jgi:hypothetical protein
MNRLDVDSFKGKPLNTDSLAYRRWLLLAISGINDLEEYDHVAPRTHSWEEVYVHDIQSFLGVIYLVAVRPVAVHSLGKRADLSTAALRSNSTLAIIQFPENTYRIRHLTNLVARAGRPSSLPVMAMIDVSLPPYRESPVQNVLTTPSTVFYSSILVAGQALS